LLAILAILAVPPLAQAQSPAVLKWAEVGKPGAKGKVIVTPSEVSRIVAGRGDILYAIDSENSKVYRSDNGGLSWTDITSSLVAAGAVLPASEIAVTPDRPQNVAVVTDSGAKVYLSTNSGGKWSDTQTHSLSGTIQCITTSTAYAGASDPRWDIAIGTAAWGDVTSTGQVWVFQLGGIASSWRNQNIIVDPSHTGAEISAIAFSPKYKSDGTILVAASTAADVTPGYQNKTWLCIGQRDLSLQTTSWNNPAGYPVEIATIASPSAGDAAGVSRIASSLALPSDYVGTTTTSRKVFVSYDRQPDALDANDDVYRLDDTTQFRLNAAGGATIGISNISYYGKLTPGSGKLLAGDVQPATASTVQVRRSSNPLVSSPAWQLASQPPSGPGNAVVSWSYRGTAAYCGTGQSPGVALDESAFSRSLDNGDSWEQISLIDTIIQISDIAPAPDSKSLFLATYNAFSSEGVWRSAGESLGNFWGRVLTMNTDSDRIILRLSPNYSTDYTIYAVEAGGSQLAVSQNRGNSWQWRYIPGPVIDMSIADKDTIYVALPSGFIRKSVNGGYTWQDAVTTDLSDINMLAVAKGEHVLAGSRYGKVAYSTNGGDSFIEITKFINNVSGDVQVVADANYGENRTIYAATSIADEGIWRWVIGLSTEWEQIDKPVTGLGTGQCISGLVTGNKGTLYALRSEPVDGIGGGGMGRSLNPCEPHATQIEFDIVNATLPVGTTFDPTIIFPNTLPHLKLSGDSNQNELWAVDTASNTIYRFQDNLCKIGAKTAATGEIGCDPVSGRNQGFGLAWEQLSLSDQYELHLAKNDIFSLRLPTVEPASNPFYMPTQVISPAYYINPGQILECAHTYYWRVRTRHAATGETIRSPWSEIKSFIIKAGLPVSTPYLGIQLLSPANSICNWTIKPASFSWSPFKETTKYRFELSRNADTSSPLISTEVTETAYEHDGALEYSTIYFWRVMALEPAPSDWSATFVFQTEPAPPAPLPLPAGSPATPFGGWVAIAIGAVLMIAILVLIVKTGRI